MSGRGASNESLKGDYNKRAGAEAMRNVHNQPKSYAGKKNKK